MRKEEIIITRTTRNPFGHMIVSGCCSCQHKTINQEGVRYCPKRRKKVGQMNICKEWQLSALLKKLHPGLDKAAEAIAQSKE